MSDVSTEQRLAYLGSVLLKPVAVTLAEWLCVPRLIALANKAGLVARRRLLQ
jgi:hypothetical protein